MLSWIRSRLFVRQTVYVLSAVILLATAISVVEVLIEYRVARTRLTSAMNQWFESVADTSSRAAYHVDPLQAGAALDGLMKFRSIVHATIKTDLGVTLAERRRTVPSSIADPLAAWLFEDLTRQQWALVFDLATVRPTTGPAACGQDSSPSETVRTNRANISRACEAARGEEVLCRARRTRERRARAARISVQNQQR